MERKTFTIHIAFCPLSDRHDQFMPQFIRCNEEHERDRLMKLMQEFMAFSALFTWLRVRIEDVEQQATEPVVYAAKFRSGTTTPPDVIVIIGNEGTGGAVAMKREFPKTIVLWSMYTGAGQPDVHLRADDTNSVVTCHDLDADALKTKVHELLAEKFGVTFAS